MHPALRRQNMAQHFLGRRLADGAGDGDDLRGAAVAGGAAEADHRFQHIIDDDHRRDQAAERRQLAFADDQQGRPVRNGDAGIIMAVDTVAFDRKKGLSLTKGAAIDGNAVDAFRQVSKRPAMHGGQKIGSGPEIAQIIGLPRSPQGLSSVRHGRRTAG